MKEPEQTGKPANSGSEIADCSAARIPLARLKPVAISQAYRLPSELSMPLKQNVRKSSVGPPLACLKPNVDRYSPNPSNVKSRSEVEIPSANNKYAALSPTSPKSLESDVRRLHKRLWTETRRAGLQGNDRLLATINPYFAAEVLGFYVELSSNQREDLTAVKRQGIAATLDRQRGAIWIRSGQTEPERRFCIAHELGHLVRHPGVSFHRDRIGAFLTDHRPGIEQEADRFASIFLMPAQLVRSEFEARFGGIQYIQRDELIFYLRLLGKRRLSSTRDWSLAFATARRIRELKFTPLHEVFSVSALAMAIRLEDLGLVRL